MCRRAADAGGVTPRIATTEWQDPEAWRSIHTLPFAIAPTNDLHVVQEGIPDVIPVEQCVLGWQESLVQLARLVEPDTPG
jgi:hypothetical protein